jgi:ribosome-associated protein
VPRINRHLEIPDAELRFEFSRSGGPGGQYVNKVATKAALRFDLNASTVLSDEQKAVLRERLASRITAAGELLLTCSEHRTQPENKRAVTARFVALLAAALRPVRPRRPTAPTRGSRERRLGAKHGRGEIKRLRRPPAAE